MDHDQLCDERRRKESQKPDSGGACWRRFCANAWLDRLSYGSGRRLDVGRPMRIVRGLLRGSRRHPHAVTPLSPPEPKVLQAKAQPVETLEAWTAWGSLFVAGQC
jgi:hypothetical protein